MSAPKSHVLGDCQPAVEAPHAGDDTCSVRVRVPVWGDEGRLCAGPFSCIFFLSLHSLFLALEVLMNSYSTSGRPAILVPELAPENSDLC